MLRQGKYGNFIGCGSYPKCKFTMSLPQGMIKKEGECEECGNAMVVRIIKGKRPWKFCINPNCGTRKEAEEKRKAFKEKYYKGDEKEKNKKDM